MCFFSIPVSGTISQDSENKLDKQASSLLMDRRISGTAELSALIVKAKWEGLGRGGDFGIAFLVG